MKWPFGSRRKPDPEDDKIDTLIERIARLEKLATTAVEKIAEIRQLTGPFAATFPDGSMLTQTIHGTKYFIDPDDLIIAPQMVIYRQWEADLSELFRKLCTPNSVVVDVGANFGYFTVMGANLIGTGGSGQVFAFEPNPKLAGLLRRNLEVNWSIAPVIFHEAAVGDDAGEITLFVPEGHGANASLSAAQGVACSEVKVPLLRLDDTLPSDLTIDLMKIDVEGHEAAVLRGARATISRSTNLHLILEWSRKQMEQAGVDPAEILTLLDGFTPHRIELNQPPLAHPETAQWLMDQDYADVLFVRRQG